MIKIVKCDYMVLFSFSAHAFFVISFVIAAVVLLLLKPLLLLSL